MRRRSASERAAWAPLVVAIPLQWLSVLAAALWSGADASLSDPLVLANVVLLGPVAVAAAAVIGLRLAGVVGAAVAAAFVLAAPWLFVATALRNYDETAREAMLPLLVGLAPDPGYAAGAAAIAGLALLTFDGRAAAAAAGVALGLAGLLVPAAFAFAAAAVFALLVAWAPMRAAIVGGAAAVFVVAAAVAGGLEAEPRTFDALVGTLDGFREYFWSKRVVEWLPLAGAFALGRLSLVAGVAAGGGVVAFAVAQLSRSDNSFEGAAVFSRLLPGIPAYALLVAAVPLLVPTLVTRLPRVPRAYASSDRA